MANKTELAAMVSEKAGLSKADATRAVDATIDAVLEELRRGNDVRLVGFGTFRVSTRAASEGRNPRTGEPIKIPESKRLQFKAGKQAIDTVNRR